MAPAVLKETLRKQPFAPFRLVQTDGTGYEIRHPDMLFIGLTEAAVGLPSSADPSLWERFVTVDLRHVIRLEPLAAASQTSEAGHA